MTKNNWKAKDIFKKYFSLSQFSVFVICFNCRSDPIKEFKTTMMNIKNEKIPSSAKTCR